MLEIIVTVPPARDRAAGLRIVDGDRTIVDDWAVATVDPEFARRAKNAAADPLRPGGHPALGRYELTAQGPAPRGSETEYGDTVLLFEPVSGQALDAESYGRLALLVYSGRMAPDSRLRRTQGGLRLGTMAMDMLVARIDAATPVELRIELAAKPAWWAFWRKPRVHPSLSSRPPQFAAPPLDEASLMAALMQQAQRRVRRQRDDDDDWERRRERESSRETRSSSSDPQEFRGRGGEGGGAGASGAWSDAPAAGRGPGVDAAGRIVATAGAAAIVTAAAIAAREASAGERALSGSDDAGAGSAVRAASSGDAGSPSSSTDSGGESNWSTTGTSY